MSHHKSKVVRIQESHQQPRLSPAQKKFNSLIQKIDAQKKILAVWQETLPLCQKEVAENLMPLLETLHEHQVEMVKLVDTLNHTQKFTRSQQDKIASFITGMCEDLIGQGYEDLKPLYNQYSGWDYDDAELEGNEAAGDILKSMFEQEFGVELSDDEFDFSDPKGMADRLAEKVEEQQRLAEEARPKRKKTAKQLAKEAREQEEEANVSKSIQAVYRQLVATLHPDREPDQAERERKTELMKQVTVAYGNKDLLKLLELQLSVEQIDQSKINNIADDRLKHYNKVLQNQLDELQDEVMQLEMDMKEMAQVSPFERLTPARMISLLNQDIVMLRREVTRIQAELTRFQDVKQFKAWLKSYRIPEPEFDPFSYDFPPF
ncbi:MAG: molecular chaperone DnaJ [Sulfuricella sp.]|nr:molecular chaperone DnaJ [Sulfuricella sp.]